MKLREYWWLRVIMVVALVLLLPTGSLCAQDLLQRSSEEGAQRVLTVRGDMWMPYNGAPPAPLPGYMVELAQEIYAPLGVQVEYDLMPWSRAVEECKHGRITAIIGAGEDRRPDFVLPEEEIGWSGYGWYVRTGFPWSFAGVDSLRGVRLGVCDGCTYDAELNAYILAHQGTDAVQPLGGEDMVKGNLTKLLANRIDVFYEDPVVVHWALRRMQAEDKVQLVAMAAQDKFERIYMAFSKALPESAELARQFDDGVRRLRASGRLAEILANYNLTDWKSQLPGAAQ